MTPSAVAPPAPDPSAGTDPGTGTGDDAGPTDPSPDAGAAPDPGTAPAPEATPAPEVELPPLDSAADVAAAMPVIEGDLGHLQPAKPGEIVQIDPGVTVALDRVERVDAQVSGPGEVSGPAVVLTVSVTNGSTSPLTLDGAVVNLYGQGGTPGSVYSSDPRVRPLTGDLDPGAQQSGTYVLSLPSTIDGELVVSVSLGVDLPTPVFIATVLQES